MNSLTKKSFISRNIGEYQILIKTDLSGSCAYCPQINKLIKGELPDELKIEMRSHIDDYIKTLPFDENDKFYLDNLDEKIYHIKDEIKSQLLSKFSKTKPDESDAFQDDKTLIRQSVQTEQSPVTGNLLQDAIIEEEDLSDFEGYFFNPDSAI